ncbi:ATP phosphoribosyltransferase [Pseudenhygromyxa sp. WMMC2535]|uniref:ATP phosphoribosyltransferase n=1 Tax=Pseudenhygromyxa sp. WMMC2535 TaxID=2712867 RepID=UPI001551677A|nr:ATP phosphoribosyltransferase [Pseudenhygromyxa sp. WMMC2535]NVB39281.1 ATP phosphoribosyltransferase [Pseudenhygromyxa sp. WMMC2535]
MAPVPEPLTFALPKGRILERATPLLAAAGLELGPALEAAGRKLLFELPSGDRILLVKPVDVPTYVDHGIADLGIAGLDTLLEQGRDLYEPVDLGIGRCRMAVAEPADRPARLRRGMTLRVATKYPACALRHYRAKGIQPDIIHLFGSVELGAITSLADQIVDLVESGETLRQNRLVEVETVFEVSSRLIVNAASLRLKEPAVSRTISALRVALQRQRQARKAAAAS